MSSDWKIQELGWWQWHLKNIQTHDIDHSILFSAHSQLASIPMARRLYLDSKKLAAADEHLCYDTHLSTLSVLCKIKDLVSLESCCGTWNRLLQGGNPGQFSFTLRAVFKSTTMEHPMQCKVCVVRWFLAYYCTCFGGCPTALTQGRYIYRHNQVLNCITTELSKVLSE